MQRPTVVTVFGILNIVFGALGLSCAPCSLLWTLKPDILPRGPGPNPVAEILVNSPDLRNWYIFSTVLGTLASALLLVAGIGLLNMKSWGRTLSIAYAIYALINTLANLVVQYFLLIVPLMEKGRGQPQAMAGAIGGAIVWTLAGLTALIYPIILLCFMYTPTVVKAFWPAASSFSQENCRDEWDEEEDEE